MTVKGRNKIAVNLHLHPDLHLEVAEESQKRGWTMTELIRRGIEHYLAILHEDERRKSAED